MIGTDWTDKDRSALEGTLREEHIQKLLLRLQLQSLPSSKEVIHQSGLDLKEMASQAHAFIRGRVSILESIDEHLPVQIPKPLGKPFQAPKLPEPPDLRDMPVPKTE